MNGCGREDIADRKKIIPLNNLNLSGDKNVKNNGGTIVYLMLGSKNAHIIRTPVSQNWVKTKKNKQILCGDFNTPKHESLEYGLITFGQNIDKMGKPKIKVRFRCFII